MNRTVGKALAGAVLAVGLIGAAGCLPAGTDPAAIHADPFLVCTRTHESDRSDVSGTGLHDAGYQAYNAGGPYLGAYQFLQSTWNSVAIHADYPWLYGVDPRQATEWEQDAMAWELYLWQGKAPWGGRC